MSRPDQPLRSSLSAGRILSHLSVLVLVAAVVGLIASGLALPFVGALGFGAKGVSKSMEDLPAELETQELAQRSQILDAKGNVIAILYDENRITVPLSRISRKMVKALVAIEDYRFYQHGALDLKGTLRALVTNQANAGVVQGGSSITQQMVKLTLVDQAKTRKERRAAVDDTYARKIRELRYAIAVEENHTKDWILERYLNIAYFGDGAYGIQSAAKHYFDKNAKDLDLRESAMLAGLVKNPTGYDPTNAPDRALTRRNVVLDRMAQLGVIGESRAEKIKGKGLGLDPQKSTNGCLNSRAPFFCDYVVNYLEQDPKLGSSVKERRQYLKTGGLTIRTTVDLQMQAAADRSVKSHVYQTDQAIGGLALVEPGSGDVKAIAQSRPMGTRKKAGETFLNYVVPEQYGDAKGFQAGSTFKAFVLASAIEQGFSMNESLPSPQSRVFQESDYKNCDGGPYGYGVWPVGNSTSSASSNNMYTGTRLSVNTYFAALEQKTGLCEPYRLAKDMGIRLTHPNGVDGYGVERSPAFTLGVANTSPLEMAEAYATFAARGLHCDSRPVTSIEDSEGAEVRNYASDCKQVIPSGVADAVSDVLRGVQEPGGFGYDNGLGLGQDSAAKTGTINSNMAVWYVGYTANLAAASMIAGANQEGSWITLNGQTVGGSYVGSAFGSTLAGPMWGDAMHAIEARLPDTEFVPPNPTDIIGVQAIVPPVSGLSLADAEARLQAAGFRTTVSGYVDSSYPVDIVAYTSPGGGASFASGDTVAIYQSDGTPYRPPKKNKKGKRGKRGGKGRN